MSCLNYNCRLPRLAGMFALAAVALLFRPGDAQAGVIVPWAQGRSVVDLDFSIDSVGSTAAPAVPAADPSDQQDNRGFPAGPDFTGNFERANGGASAPTSGPPVQLSSASAIVFSSPSIAPPAVAFEYLREQATDLPQPPLGELLDPPKA